MDDARHYDVGSHSRGTVSAQPGWPEHPENAAPTSRFEDTLTLDDSRPAPAPAADDEPPVPPERTPRHGRRRRRWPIVLGVLLLVLTLAAAGAGIAYEHSQLNTTRNDLAALRSAQANDMAHVQSSFADQQQKLSTLAGQLATTQTQLQAAQSRLTTAEKQLSVATQKLPPDLTQLAAAVSPSVVLVSCVAGTTSDTGTAFALDLPVAAGFSTTLVTAAHVVSACVDARANPVLTISSGSRVWDAHIRALDSDNDVAILATTAKLPVLKAATGPPVVGQFVMAVGNPLGVVNNVTSGNVSQVYDDYILATAPVSNGNSGGPLIDKDGNVVAIVQGAATPNQSAPVVENLNVSLRLSTLCLKVLHGSVCSALH
jgi:serine protease Do